MHVVIIRQPLALNRLRWGTKLQASWQPVAASTTNRDLSLTRNVNGQVEPFHFASRMAMAMAMAVWRDGGAGIYYCLHTAMLRPPLRPTALEIGVSASSHPRVTAICLHLQLGLFSFLHLHLSSSIILPTTQDWLQLSSSAVLSLLLLLLSLSLSLSASPVLT